MKDLGPQLERLYAVAASGGIAAIGGARDYPGATTSEVHLIALSKMEARGAFAVKGAVHALCFVRDDLLAVGSSEGRLLFLDPSGSEIRKKGESELFRGPIEALAASPKGDRLYAAGQSGKLAAIRLGEGAGTQLIDASSRALACVAVDAEHRLVAAGGEDGVIRVYQAADLSAPPREMPCGEGGITALAFTGDGRVVAGCGDGSIYTCFLEGAVDAEDRAGDNAHQGPVRGLLFGPQIFDETKKPVPRRLFSMGGGTLRGWELDSRRRPKNIDLGEGHLRAMVWAEPKGRSEIYGKEGALLLVDERRRLTSFPLDERSRVVDQRHRLASKLTALSRDLEARGDKVRLDAIGELIKIPEDGARRLLERALEKDAKPEVKKAAAEAIGRSDRRRSRPALRVALSDPQPSVRAEALDALTRIEKEAPLSVARAALASRYGDIRKKALLRLPLLREASPLVPGLIASALSDADEKVREAAFQGLRTLWGRKSIEPARIAMSRGPADVRQTALLSLGTDRLHLEGAGWELVEDALDDAEASVREVAYHVAISSRPKLATILRQIDEKTAKTIKNLEKNGRLFDRVPLDATAADGTAADGEAGPLGEGERVPLFAAMACRSSDTAIRGARALALLADPRATDALLQLSREGVAEVRRAATEAILAGALSMPADGRLSARLLWLLDDPDTQVRAAAFDALTALAEPRGDQGLLELAEAALRCAHEDIRLRSLQVLVQYGGGGPRTGVAALTERADRLLGDALDDEAPKVRTEAFRTLWAWHSRSPRAALERGAGSRHADVRAIIVKELERQTTQWAEALLLRLVEDADTEVGLAAFARLTDKDKKGDPDRLDAHEAALRSPRPMVRAAGLKSLKKAHWEATRARVLELVDEDRPEVYRAAIEAVDRLHPEEQVAFARAFDSIYYDLRVRAAELCGRRRDGRAIEPMRRLLTIPKHHLNRPSDDLRHRAISAMADVGDASLIPFFFDFLGDLDPIVREHAARGLATCARPGDEQDLLDALSHADLAVRSWVGEGLARLGDDRAFPVLAGTLSHHHRPIRLGAIMGFVALGPDGVRGILQGLDDADREIQDLVFAVIVARDRALAKAGIDPDLLLSALASSHPEIRLAAARVLEMRGDPEALHEVSLELIGPRRPDRAADMKDWPSAEEQRARLSILVEALASDHPAQRYATTQVLSLRPKPLVFWREVKRLVGPAAIRSAERAGWVPHTAWAAEQKEPRKKGWIRRLVGARPEVRAEESATERVLTVLRFAGSRRPRAVPPSEARLEPAAIRELVFGTYAGLVRQAPAAAPGGQSPGGQAASQGAGDETHRIRRDAVTAAARLAAHEEVGRDAVLPVLRRALSDPHHLVRKAATTALKGLYPERPLVPLSLMLESSAPDVGRAAVDDIVIRAALPELGPDAEEGAAAPARDEAGEAALRLATQSVEAPLADVRRYAMTRLPRLYPAGSQEPWLIALNSRHADVRLSVVDRLVDSASAEVLKALSAAMESDHVDLRLRAASALARRGDARTVDVLAGLLRSEEDRTWRQALGALIALAHARPGSDENDAARAAAAEAVVARIEDDPDQTANVPELLSALARIKSPAAAELLLGMLGSDSAPRRSQAYKTLHEIALDPARPAVLLKEGGRRLRFFEDRALRYAGEALKSSDPALRKEALATLQDVDDREAEGLLAALLEDRDAEVRVAACMAIAARSLHVEGADIEVLRMALKGGRRELTLPAAEALAQHRLPEAFKSLLLVYKAGEQQDRPRALLALGTLGDERALPELMALIDPEEALEPEDQAMIPYAAEALARLTPHLSGDAQATARERVDRLARQEAVPTRLRVLSGLRHAGDARSRATLEAIAADRFDNAQVSLAAIHELGMLGDPEAEAALADSLHHTNWQIRNAAEVALKALFPKDLTRVNLHLLSSPFPDMSQRAAAFLAGRGDAATLIGRLREIKDARVRQQLRQGLVRRGLCPADQLRPLLTGDDVGMRAEAAWIAGAAAEASLREALRQAADESAVGWAGALAAGDLAAGDGAGAGVALREAWHASLWALHRVGDEEGAASVARGALSALAAGRADAASHKALRLLCLRVLREVGNAEDFDRLRPLLLDGDGDVRAAAARALAKLAPARAEELVRDASVSDMAAVAPMVEAALRSTPGAGRGLLAEGRTRRFALPVLLGAGRDAELLALLAEGGESEARLSAIASLGRVGTEAAGEALSALLAREGEPDKVRAAAFRALRKLQRKQARVERFAQETEAARGRS